MEEEIKKIVKLANDYALFGNLSYLPEGHNHLRGGYNDVDYPYEKGDLVNVYFSDNRKVWAVYFGEIEITGYSNKIIFPITHTAKDLEDAYVSSKKYLKEFLSSRTSEIRAFNMEVESIQNK